MGRHEIFNLSDLSEVIQAVEHHNNGALYIQDYVRNNPAFEGVHKLLCPKGYIDTNWVGDWCKINIHIVEQTWASTAGGWGGIGGAAMSTYRTVVIEARYTVSVYWNGRLAYIVKRDELYKEYIKNKGYELPGMNAVSSNLLVLYKNKNRK